MNLFSLQPTFFLLANPIAAAIAMILIPAISKDENGDDMPLTVGIVFDYPFVQNG